MNHDIFFSTPSGQKLHLADWGGNGEPMLLLHGMGGHAHWWDSVAPRLAQRFRVLALDFRGHGDSAWSEPPLYEIPDYVSDIEAARSHLGWDNFNLTAHSLGARMAIHYAEENPGRVRKLAALDFLTEKDRGSATHFRKRRRLIRQPSYSDPEEVVRRFHLQPDGTVVSREVLEKLGRLAIRRTENGRWTWKFDWRAFGLDYTPFWEVMARLSVSCLVLRGEKSIVMPQEAYERVVSQIPFCRGVVIPEAHHHVTIDKPEEVARHLVEFFIPAAPGS